uniref:Uncharacterized protein n=1 Tax=Heterosigma akashiwo TaxID=2829 RepID=A0A7S3UQL6_HETAK
MICCAIFLALCPARYLYTAGVLFFFSKPLRDDKPPLPIILLLHFFKGIPTGSHTHTHLQMESIYNSESTSRQLALRRRLHDGEDSNIVINSSSSSNEEEEHKNSAAATTTDGGN